MNPFLSADPQTMAALTTAPFLEQVIQYLKEEWNLPSKFAALVALLLGIVTSVAYSIYVHNATGNELNYLNAVTIGLTTGFATSFWHEVRN